MNIKQTLQLLDIQEVTTKRQKKNGTREFTLPVKCQYGGAIHVASFASGYVRRTKAGGYCPSWQLNKRVESEPQRYGPFEDGTYREFTTRTCKLIPYEIDRLEYLIAFCLKNYYIGQANMLSSGRFVPKWKHENELDKAWSDGHAGNNDVSVIVNGQKYKVI